MPRTKPAISRPPVMLSSMAYSSATASGLLSSGSARPSTAILHVLGPARERAGHDAGDRHQAVGVLMMLVDAHAVEAELVGIFEFVEIAVVELVALLRDRNSCSAASPRPSCTSCRNRDRDPRTASDGTRRISWPRLLDERRRSWRRTRSVFSICGRWPQFLMTSSFEPGISFAIGRAVGRRDDLVVVAPQRSASARRCGAATCAGAGCRAAAARRAWRGRAVLHLAMLLAPRRAGCASMRSASFWSWNRLRTHSSGDQRKIVALAHARDVDAGRRRKHERLAAARRCAPRSRRRSSRRAMCRPD